MPNLYARATALPNIVGRCDYISNPNRQENLLAVYDGAQKLLDGRYWETLAQESQAAFEQFGQKTRTFKNSKTGELEERKLKCCQGRESVIQLSNSLLDKMQPEKIAKVIAWEYKKKLGLDVLVAVHYNAKKNNLHAHVIFPERQLMAEPVIKTAERNLFFNAEGKRVYKKGEILDADKQLLPGCRIVKKGEVYEQRYFTAANPKFQSKRWLAHVKSNVILPMLNGKLRGDVEIKEYDPSTGELPQQHVGVVEHIDKPGAQAKVAGIRQYNNEIKAYNRRVRSGEIPLDVALKIQAAVNGSEDKHKTLMAEVEAFEKSRAQAQEQQAKVQLMVTMKAALEIRKAEQLKQEQQVVVVHPAVLVAQNERQPIWDLGELAGITRPEIDRMFDSIQKASKTDMQLMWAQYRKGKEEFWAEYNSQMNDLRKEISEAYRQRKFAKSMEWMGDPRNRRTSLLGLVVVLVYLSVRKESVRSLDDKINHLKEKQEALRRQATAFKEVAGNTVATLKDYGRPLEEYVEAVQDMQSLADRLQGKYAPFMARTPEPVRLQPKKEPEVVPAPANVDFRPEGVNLAYYGVLRTAYRKKQEADLERSRQLIRFGELYGPVRKVDQNIISLPSRMAGCCDGITHCLKLIQEEKKILSEKPPVKPFIAGKKKKEQYEQDLSEHQKRMDSAERTIERAQKDIAGYLRFLGRYLDERAMRPPMKGERLTAENIDLQDMIHLSDAVRRETEHGNVYLDAKNESRYAEGLSRYEQFEAAANAARIEYEKVQRDKRYPANIRAQAARAVEAEWKYERNLLVEQQQVKDKPEKAKITPSNFDER